jgi:DNA-binding transcriptional LysR family regulator
VDVHQLRCFLAVAEERHFGRAAERLHLTTSPVSRAVRDLEREAGVPLFVRGPREATLTPAGVRLAQRGTAVLAGFDGLLADVRTVAEADRLVVRLGSTHLTEPEIVDAVVECAERVHLDRTVTVDLRQPAELLALLERDALDVVVDYVPITSPALRTRALVSYRMGVAMRSADPLAGRPELTVADLAGRTVQLLCPGPVPEAVARIRRYLEDKGARDVRIYPVGDVMQLAEHVRRTGDLSLAFVNVKTGATRAFHDPAFVVRSVVDGPELDLGIAWRADREDTPVVRAVLAEVAARWPQVHRRG